MTSANIIITLVAFLGVITILGINAGQDIAITQDLTNQTNANITFLNLTETGQINPPTCDFSIPIPILGGLIWGADCVAKYVGFYFGLMSISFSDAWIMFIIITPVLVALIYLVIRELVRGSGGG